MAPLLIGGNRMTIFLLWLLATMDAAFIGYREAAGRNALIDKRKYYLKAMLRGAIFGQAAIVLAGVGALLLAWLSGDPTKLMDDLLKAGPNMLWVYIPFAMIIFLAFALRMLPSVDIKSITSTVIFGPFTMLRPLVAIGGLIYGLMAAPSPQVFALCVLAGVMMLGMEWALGKTRRLQHGG